jgi:hypothetical protein
MDSQSLGNHFSRVSVHRRTFPLLRGFGTIVSKKRLGSNLKLVGRKVIRTWPLSVRRREKERVPKRERARS